MINLLLFFLPFLPITGAQGKPQTVIEIPAAKSVDVDSIEHVLGAVYASISGPAGHRGDWDRFRSLFIADARLISVNASGQKEVAPRVLTLEQFIERASTNSATTAFFERELARHVDQFAHIAQVFSTYESRHSLDSKPFARGINSFQLMNDGKRWWIVTIYWEAEHPETPIPEKYLVPGQN